MVFRLGSVTKQFTAAAILLLEEDGQLKVTDSITDYLPDYPTNGHTITIEHLLTHTSGIYSYTDIPGYMATTVRQDMTVEELVEQFQDQPMEFSPGERWSYSNSGYILLGAILEGVAGVSYAEFLEKRIFGPLKLQQTYYGGPQIIPNRVTGYDNDADGLRNAYPLSMTQPYAAGSILSTVDDLAQWNAALFGGDLLSPASLEKMTTAFTLNDGSSANYGYGLATTQLRGSAALTHGGGIFGFRTLGIHIPDHDVYVAVLSNNSGHQPDTGYVGLKVAAMVLEKPFEDFKAIQVDPGLLDRLTGSYQINEGNVRVVTVDEGRLFTQRTGGDRLEAVPFSKTGFFYRDTLTHFEIVLDEQGVPIRMLMYHDGSDDPESADYLDPVPSDDDSE
jgi:CubicO group peptidase (beta-lactamase class C family)